MIGGAMLLLPGYAVVTFVIYLFSLKFLYFFNFDNYISFFGFIDNISALEKLTFLAILMGITFYLNEKTKWGELTNKILPFERFNYSD